MSVESPRLLILETSGRSAQVAVALGGSLLARLRLDEPRRHLRERDVDPLLFEDREDEPIAGIVDRRRLIHLADPAQGVEARHPVAKTG